MNSHKVKMLQPERIIQKSDVMFSVWKGKQRVGSLGVSSGGIEWWQASAKKSRRLTWWDLAKLMEAKRKSS
jgi:hypothetical protein